VKVNYQTTIEIDGGPVKTLLDIVPQRGPLRMLIIAKTPAPVSVEAGHYFQGAQGRMFWNSLLIIAFSLVRLITTTMNYS